MGYVINADGFGSIPLKYLMFLKFLFFKIYYSGKWWKMCRSCSVLIFFLFIFCYKVNGLFSWTLSFLSRKKFTSVMWEASGVLLITAFSNLSSSVLFILCEEKKQLHYSFILVLPVQTSFLVWFISLVLIHDIASCVKRWKWIGMFSDAGRRGCIPLRDTSLYCFFMHLVHFYVFFLLKYY